MRLHGSALRFSTDSLPLSMVSRPVGDQDSLGSTTGEVTVNEGLGAGIGGAGGVN